MTDCVLVTGAGSGIGRALALELCRKSFHVIGTGRRPDALKQTADLVAKAGNGTFHGVPADVATEEGRKTLITAVEPAKSLRYIAQLAGAYSVAPLDRITVEEWRQAFGVNVEARLFLTRDLLPHLAPGSRVAFTHSGTGEVPRLGAAAASASMAAAIMVRRCLANELSASGILVSATRPGPVNSEMMRRIQQTEPTLFPDVTKFRDLRLVAPETCARYFAWWLTETRDDDYVKDGWDLEDQSHHHHWLDGDSPYE